MRPEDLLAHADFVRGLARLLVADDHRAEDISQQTLAAALKLPPRSVRSPRAWLAQVVRNFSRQAFRGESRKRKREQAAARPEAIPSAADVVQREETRKQVVDAVLSLQEPYLSTILLRFYEDLPPREVARHLDVPGATVRTRLKRGLEQLREKLDALHAGDRQAWTLALIPLTGWHLSPPATAGGMSGTAAATTGTGLSGILAGVIAMGIKAKVVIALLSATSLALIVFTALPEADQANGREEGRTVDQARILPAEPGSSGSGSPVALAGNSIRNSTEEDPLRKEHLAELKRYLSGQVVDKQTFQPVVAYEISLVNEQGIAVVAYPVKDEEGRFHFPLTASGVLSLNVNSASHLPHRGNPLALAEEERSTDRIIQLDPGGRVTGRVVDDATGRPLAGVLVGNSGSFPRTDPRALLKGQDHSCPHTRTDAQGRFVLSGLDNVWQQIVGVHPDYAEGFVRHNPEEHQPVEIRLKPGLRIFGKIFSDQGEPLGGVLISLEGELIPLMRMVYSREDGSFRLPPALPEEVVVKAFPDVVPEVGQLPDFSGLEQFSPEGKLIKLLHQDVEVNFGLTAAHTLWRGTAYDFDGTPLAGALIALNPCTQDRRSTIQPEIAACARCNSEGFFEVRKLTQSCYDITVLLANGLDQVQMGEVEVGGEGVIEKDLHLRGGTLRGVIIDDNTGEPINGLNPYLTARPQPRGRPMRARVDEEGRYCLRSLPEGAYELFYSDGFGRGSFLRKVEIGRDEVLDRFVLHLPASGFLNLILEGFNYRALRLELQATNETKFMAPLNQAKENQTIEQTIRLESGSWTLHLAHNELGNFTRDFRIDSKQSTKIHIDRQSFQQGKACDPQAVTLAGKLIHPQGGPVGGQELILQARSDTGLRGQDLYRTCTTGADGSFCLQEMRWGLWDFYLGGEHTTRTWWCLFSIPENAADPFPADLILPTARISGILYDRATGLTLGKEASLSHFALLWARNSARVVTLNRQSVSDRFDMTHLNAGEYILEVEFRFYRDFQSEILTLDQDEHLDLGWIELEPCGLLILEVKDPGGHPIATLKAENLLTGEPLHRLGRRGPWAADGKYEYNNLPLGRSRIRITTLQDRFQEVEFEVDCRTGIAVERKIVMQRKGE